MTRTEIINMAREVWSTPAILPTLELVQFARLVAKAEREACAQLVEKNADVCGTNTMLCDVLRGNAAAIRARGDQK